MQKAGQPQVTVFIPTYNRSGWLEGAIESVLAQTCADLRLVVSDNASSDATAEVVARFDDARITYRRRERNVDLNTHFNRCAAEADTPFVLLLPDDDRLVPDAIERTLAVLESSPRVGLVHGQADVVDRDGALIAAGHQMTGLDEGAVESGAEFIERTMESGFRVNASTALVRTAALDGLELEREDFPATDLGLWLRLALEWDVAFLARPLAVYRIHEHSYSSATASVTDGGYTQGLERIVNVRDVKQRFVAQHRAQLRRPRGLRRIADRAFRRDLLAHVAESTYRERQLVPTTRALFRCARMAPATMLEPAAWRLLASATLGPRLTTAIRNRKTTGATA